jgi:hypothetical protein
MIEESDLAASFTTPEKVFSTAARFVANKCQASAWLFLWINRLIEVNPKHARQKCEHGHKGQEK